MTTFHQLLRSSAERFGENTAILFEDQQLTYADLLTTAEGLASGLAAHGIGAHDHLAIIMDNSLECIVSWLASSVIGCTDVPINPEYRGELLYYLLSDSGTTALICDERYLPEILGLMKRLPSLKHVLVNGSACFAGKGNIPLTDLASCMLREPFAQTAEAAERVILYTSGTTGPSKGVMHTQKSCLVLARYNADVLGYDASDRLLNFFPLFHQNARYTGVIPALAVGATIRVERRLSTSTFWQTCDRDEITAFNYLGSVLRMILNVTGPERRAGTHSIRRAFGAGAAPDIWQEFEERLGIRLFETYGLSEAPMATINVPGDARCPIGSAGRSSDLFEVAVFGENDQPLQAGEVGEIVLRPRRPDAMMIGYHNNDDATVSAFRNLWFHSGDRGYLSEAGHLFFEERQKDSIRRRGENISAWEVESVIQQHPDVAEAAVYGMSCDDLEEEVAVTIVPSAEAVDLLTIFVFARERLPRYAVPTLMRVASDLPRTPTAKVKKDELRIVPRDQHTDVTNLNGATEPSGKA